MADLSMLGGAEDDHSELKKLNAEVVCKPHANLHKINLKSLFLTYALLTFTSSKLSFSIPTTSTRGKKSCALVRHLMAVA